jgi:hypothetical protein
MDYFTPFHVGYDEFVDMLVELILLVHDFALVMFLLVLLMLSPLDIFVVFLMIVSFFSSS